MHLPKLYFLGMLLCFIACQTKQSDYKSIFENKEAGSTISSFSLLDTLSKYESSDSILLTYQRLNATLLINAVNAHKYAVWIITDSILLFYQQDWHQKWQATDTLKYDLGFSFATHEDLNGDNLKDIKISCISGSAGNLDNRVFLFDSATKTFKHNAHYDLLNIEYDPEGKFIKSWWLAGVVHCQEKWKYRITGDSLALELGVSCCPDEHTQGKTAILTFYKELKGETVITKKLTGKSTKIWQTFEQSLWHSEW